MVEFGVNTVLHPLTMSEILPDANQRLSISMVWANSGSVSLRSFRVIPSGPGAQLLLISCTFFSVSLAVIKCPKALLSAFPLNLEVPKALKLSRCFPSVFKCHTNFTGWNFAAQAFNVMQSNLGWFPPSRWNRCWKCTSPDCSLSQPLLAGSSWALFLGPCFVLISGWCSYLGLRFLSGLSYWGICSSPGLTHWPVMSSAGH